MELLTEFMAHFGIAPRQAPPQLLDCVLDAFARLPYENLTKIIKHARQGSPEVSRRHPEEVIGDHKRWGTGGTCFSLTSTLAHLLRSLGYEADYILADRRYGADTHCALLLGTAEGRSLVDPGYLIARPLRLRDRGETELRTSSDSLILAAEPGGRMALYSARGAARTYRLTYKTSPVDAGQFARAWDRSFSWDMMRYPLLTRNAARGRIYLRGSRLAIRSADSVSLEIVDQDLVARIAAEFGLHVSIVAHALRLLGDRGEIGKAWRR